MTWLREDTEAGPATGGSVRTARALWVAFWGNVGMALFKIVLGGLGYSSLFIIDGLFSAALGAHVAAVMIGAQMSHGRFITRRYSYGMGKAQFLLAMLLGGVLVVAASITLGLTIKRFGHVVSVQPSNLAVVAALVATAANLVLCFYLKRTASASLRIGIGKLASFQALGVGSSLSVLQSTWLVGYHWLAAERIGRISISLLMLWLSVLVIRNALEGVMDQSTGKEIEGAIRELVTSVKEVREIRWMRTRRAGHTIHVDLEVALSKRATVGDSDRVAARIRQLLASRMEQTADVINVTFCTA